MNHATQHQVVAIHGAPRSGTSWLGQLFNSSEHVAYRYQPIFSYAFKDRLTSSSNETQIEYFFDDLLQTEDDFVLQRGDASLPGYTLDFPKTNVTHLVYKEVRYHQLIGNLLDCFPRLRLVALIRDPRAVISSWLRAPREFEPSWRAIDEWRYAPGKNGGHPENWYGFERWKELAHLFLDLRKRHPSRVYIVRYEALAAAPIETLSRLFDLCGLPITSQVRNFVCETTKRDDNHPYGVFRSRTASGVPPRPLLDSRIVQAIQADLKGTVLQQYMDE